MAFAFLLIFVGVIFFLKNIGAVSWDWAQIWPLFIIGLGLYLAQSADVDVTGITIGCGKKFPNCSNKK